MGILADRLDRMSVRVTSPDRSLAAELQGRTTVHLTLAPGVYRRIREPDLADRLATVARLLWAARMKVYYQALSEALDERITAEARPVSPRDVNYHTARDQVLAEGRSFDGRFQVSVQGMRHWTVHIAAGTLGVLGEDQFTEAVSQAAAELIQDQQVKIRELKRQCYG